MIFLNNLIFYLKIIKDQQITYLIKARMVEAYQTFLLNYTKTFNPLLNPTHLHSTPIIVRFEIFKKFRMLFD